MSGRPIPVAKPELASLWESLGGAARGEAKLAQILADFYRRMAADTMIGFMFEGPHLRAKSLDEIAQKQKEFLMRAWGAAASYSGLPPAKAHLNLPPILPGFFDRRLRILEETLKDHGLAAPLIQTWISFEEAFRDGIVSTKS